MSSAQSEIKRVTTQKIKKMKEQQKKQALN